MLLRLKQGTWFILPHYIFSVLPQIVPTIYIYTSNILIERVYYS